MAPEPGSRHHIQGMMKLSRMTTRRPVRYRCELQSRILLPTLNAQYSARTLELSLTGAFVEEPSGFPQIQVGESGLLTLSLLGGAVWTVHFRLMRFGSTRLEKPVPVGRHLSVLCQGFAVEFVDIDARNQTQLSDSLRLLDAV